MRLMRGYCGKDKFVVSGYSEEALLQKPAISPGIGWIFLHARRYVGIWA